MYVIANDGQDFKWILCIQRGWAANWVFIISGAFAELFQSGLSITSAK